MKPQYIPFIGQVSVRKEMVHPQGKNEDSLRKEQFTGDGHGARTPTRDNEAMGNPHL